MLDILSNPYHEILRFDRGDDVISGILKFAKEEKIDAAWVWALGAAEGVELGFYDLEAKEYRKKRFTEPMEIVQMTGNIAVGDNGPILHLHGSFGGRDHAVVGGHVNALIAYGTVEVFLHKIPGKILRAYDQETGLSLLD
jgi:predicted DNA-binding protein with PD1-like motif